MRYSIYIIVFSSFLVSCASQKNATDKNQPPENHSQLVNLGVTDQFLEGKRAIYTSDYPKALSHFLRCLKENPAHAPSMYEISRVYYLKQDYKESTKWAYAAYETDSENIWYLKNYIKCLKITHQYELAAEMLEKLIAAEPDTKQHYYDLANTYIAHKDYNASLKVYSQILEKFGFEEGVILQRKQIYLNQNRLKEAMAEVDLLIEHYPEETKYLGMKGHILNMMGKTEEALAIYNKIIKLDPEDGKVHLALSTLYLSIDNVDLAYQEELIAFNNPKLSIDHKISSLLRYLKKPNWGKKEESHIVDLLNTVTKVHPEEAKGHAVYGDYLIRKNRNPEALKRYQRALSLDSTQYMIWEQCVLIYNEDKNHEKVQEYCETALSLFPQHSALYFFGALASYELGDYQQSVEMCEMGINFTYKPSQQIDFMTLSGKSYVAQGNYAKALEMYEQISYLKANHPEAMAESAFCMAMLNSNLTEAEAKVRSSLELDAENKRYYYIYALVLYQQSKYTDAKHWIDKALLESTEADYFELAGDIYSKTTDKEKAKQHYQKAIELNGNQDQIKTKLESLNNR
jgi:tetratricopeptide (TPR) repeat protein